MTTLGQSFAYCDHVARNKAANFYHAFRLLPLRQRQAMSALYSFLRVADDIADAPAPQEARRIGLAEWRRQLDLALAGQYTHPIHAALHETVRRHQIPQHYLHDAIDGVAMDLDIASYATFADLLPYCYRVASVVGLSCIHIWGFCDPLALQYAESAGIAFQLTNILRDLAEDAAQGRVYLPMEDFERFGYSREALQRGDTGPQFAALMGFETRRATDYYDRAEPLVDLLPPPGRAVFLVMLRTYRGLLEEIERRSYDVFHGRIRVSAWYKLWQVLRALPVRFGWRGA